MPLERSVAGLVIVVGMLACAPREPLRVGVPMQPAIARNGSIDGGAGALDEPVGAAIAASHTLVGHWEGTGTQDDGTTWLMVVDVSSLKAGTCATVLYPTVPCTGSWTCSTDSDGRTMSAIERIAEGRRECIDGGAMRMFLSPDGALDWSWAGAGQTARARLRRTGSP